LKKAALALAVSALAALIVLPVVHSVNLSAGKPTAIVPTLRADGWPLPFPVPPAAQGHAFLTADGWPLPFPVPPAALGHTFLTADGWPLPFPVPPGKSLAV